MPNGWRKKVKKSFCSRKFRRGGSSRHEPSYWSWGGAHSYGLLGGGASSRRIVGNSRKYVGNRYPCHPGAKIEKLSRVQRSWEAKKACLKMGV
jgi:hypothetical protein